ncbi:MAG TPA: hypothetical protein VF170_13225 [Planctomycetaceae bacterium]
MRLFGRRLHFQLTPLLDLLLIVIFAQYLEVRQQAGRETVRLERRIAEREREVERRLSAAEAELAAERGRLAARERSLDAETAELRTRLGDVVEQQRRAAELVAELFDVPQELVDEALAPLPPGVPPRSAADIERLRQQFQELAELRGAEVVEHLFSYDELRKRADIWTLRIRATGEIVFSTGDRTQSFRAATRAEFASRLFDRYKTLPQPKGLVVLLVSYGDARADVRQAVLDGLPEAVRLMREDRLGRTQFEYAVLGFVADENDRAR